MLERVRRRIEKCVKFSDLYRSQKSEILYDSQKAYRATNEMVFNSVAIQLLHTILVRQAEWKSRCFIETEVECVNESLKQQSTTLYNADNTFWNDKQVYTDCLNDSSRHIDICAYTRSKLVQWDHRSQTDVSECWSRRWVVQWALSDNSWKTKIIFYCFKSENIHNEMLLEWWKKATLLQKTLSAVLRISLYRTDSVYTWLNNDWTLRKRCNWCSLITAVLLAWDATECLYILLKLWQMSYKQQLKRPLTRLFEASTCIEANLTEDIYWFCSKFTVKWGLYEPSDNYRLS